MAELVVKKKKAVMILEQSTGNESLGPGLGRKASYRSPSLQGSLLQVTVNKTHGRNQTQV